MTHRENGLLNISSFRESSANPYANVLLVFRYVLKELIQTERDYVKSLGEVVEVKLEILSATRVGCE